MGNFIEDYLDYFGNTEVPTIFDRWCCLSGIGTLLERESYIIHGQDKIYPNQYILLVGDSGSRKDTAINRIKKLVKAVGYKTISTGKTSKEKLLVDMEIGLDKIDSVEADLDVTNVKETKNPTFKALFPEYELNEDPTNCYIIAGEWNAYFGHSNIDFLDLLTELWAHDDIYTGRIKTGKSVRVPYPTINILGGNTTTGISQGFPIEVMGQGFFSRLLMIYSDPTQVKIAWPEAKDEVKYAELVRAFGEIKKLKGEFTVSKPAKVALTDIYHDWTSLKDIRFTSYSTRRFTHLLKLCQICSAAEWKQEIDVGTVIYANTILHYTEHQMPKALGEFGKARNSDVTSKVLTLLEKATEPLDLALHIWPHVQRDLDSQKQLGEIINGLRVAGKIEVFGNRFIPKKEPPNFERPFCNIMLLREHNVETSGP